MLKNAGCLIMAVLFVMVQSCVYNDLPEPTCAPGSVSYVADIKPIFETKCLLSGCHGSDPTLPNWGVLSEVQVHASDIKRRTRDRSMPATGSLTQSQIDLITCWVDDGAPDN